MNSSCSSDRILSVLTKGETYVVVQATDFGVATVTLFSENNRTDVIRVTVPVQDITLPPPPSSLQTPNGSRGSIGTRVGWQLPQSVVSQEEFFSYRDPSDSGVHEIQIKSLKPLYIPEPRPFRFLDRIFYEYDRKRRFVFRVGDTDATLEGFKTAGSIRGARADFPAANRHYYLVAGLARAGVKDFFWGEKSTPVVGTGGSYELSQAFRLNGHLVGFEKNDLIGISESGFETMVALNYKNNLITPASLRLWSDKRFRSALDVAMGIQLAPVSLSGSFMRTPADFGAYSLPTRFGSDQNSYSLSASLDPQSFWRAGLSVSDSRAITIQDQSPGNSRLKAGSASADFSPTTSLNLGLNASYYQSGFTPYTSGSSATETSQRIQSRNEYAFSPVNGVTLTAERTLFQSSRLALDYENLTFTSGWKRNFSHLTSDYLELEGGASRFRYPASPVLDGSYLLARATVSLGLDWIQLLGVAQNEIRFLGGGKNYTFRLQASALFSPSVRHELKVSVANNFEWYSRIYSQSRSLILAYVYRFGTAVPEQSLFSRFRSYELKGHVFLDENSNGHWEPEDSPFVGAEIGLGNDSGAVETRLTDSQGAFAFRGLSRGTWKVSLKDLGAHTFARLVTPSPRLVDLSSEDFHNADFVFSDQAEISGAVFSDLNGNAKADPTDPILGSLEIRYRQAGEVAWKTVGVQDGHFLLRRLKPGLYEIGASPATLPPGFRVAGDGIRQIEVTSRAILRIDFGLLPERSVHGILFWDTNKNRVFDAGEKGIDGVMVEFLGLKTMTGDGGRFIFRHLPSGEGKVRYGRSQSEPVRLRDDPASILNVFVPVDR